MAHCIPDSRTHKREEILRNCHASLGVYSELTDIRNLTDESVWKTCVSCFGLEEHKDCYTVTHISTTCHMFDIVFGSTPRLDST